MGDTRFDRCILFAANSPVVSDWPTLVPRVASGHVCYRRGFARRIAAVVAACLGCLLLQQIAGAAAAAVARHVLLLLQASCCCK